MASTGVNLATGITAVNDRTGRSGGVSSARKVELIDSRRMDSLRYNRSQFAKLQPWYNSYRGYWQGRLAQFRNNVTIPFTFAMIQSDVARKVQTTFGSWPIVTFEGYAPEDVASAKKNEVLISAQMKDCNSLLQAIDFMLQADIGGTAIARYGWKFQERPYRTVRHESVAPGLSVPVIREGKTVLFNGPTWSTIDRLDFWQQPSRKYIPEMEWVIHRYWLDYDEMLADSEQEDAYFDRVAVRLLGQYPLQGSAQAEFNARRVMYRSEFEYMARSSERYAKPVEIWEMQGNVPAEFTTDGIRHRSVCIANGRVVVRDKPSAQPGVKTFLSYTPMPDPFGFDGVGKAEVAYGPQMTVNRLANQKLDILDQAIDPTWVVSNSANINPGNLFTRAGRIILVDGAADDSNIRPLIPSLQGVQAAYTEIGQLWQFMQLGSGINDIVLGMAQGDRETARGFLGRQENVMTRLAFEARVLEEQFVEPLANAFRDLDRFMLDFPHEISILGSMATTNPGTGMSYIPERAVLLENDLAPDYRARAVGASQMMSRSVRQQNAVSLLQMMSANPAMMQLVNWANFARQMFQLFDFQNVDELLVSQVPMVNVLAAQARQSPEDLASLLSSGALPGLNPSLTQAMGNRNPTGVQSTLTGGGA